MSVVVARKGHYRPDTLRSGPAGTPAVAITAPSPLATPFKISKATDRDRMVARYADWLDARLANPGSAVAREFARLRELLGAHGRLVLLCGCAPLACHGDAMRDRLLAGTAAQAVAE